jgi:hypothetical protein
MFLSCDSVILIRTLSSLLVCVVLLQLCSCVRFYSSPYFRFYFDQLCKAWETLICGDSSKLGYWYKEDNCGTQVWSLGHLRGVECNPWPTELTTTWSRHWPNHDKNSLYFVHFTYCYYYLLEFSYSLVIFPLSLILILMEQSSEEFSFLLSSHPNLALVLTNKFYKPSLCCLVLVS